MDIHPDIEPSVIAGRLTKGQRSALLGLGTDFCVLGCSEPYALRMSNATKRRPALVEMRQGPQYKEFRLRPYGVLVRELI